MNKEIITLPENRKDRIKRLDETIEILKTEFIGLDSIIDEIKESISAWYITPEIINRPVVVSLWGMTGTGKSSLVKRLIELLGLSNTSMVFDCGECTNNDLSISSSICDVLGKDYDDLNPQVKRENNPLKNQNLVFVFDEFQYARTINEGGEEDVKSSLRPIWSLIDSGIIESTDKYSWEFNKLVGFIEDFESLVQVCPNAVIEENVINNPDDVKLVLETIGFLQYDHRQIPGITVDKTTEDDEDPYRPLKILESDKLRTINKKLNAIKPGLGIEAVSDLIKKKYTVEEFNKSLQLIYKSLLRPKNLDCSDSLVFVIGNLDEAFTVSGDMNPDIDADMFCDITSKVTISDIKNALTKRFRAEQIARLGNNLIKYPTLKKEDFYKIIKLETGRIIREFKKICPIEVEISDRIYDLLYSEGVYPTQGVRPVLTTIGTIFTPYFSKILIEYDNSKKVSINVKDDIDLKSSYIDVNIRFSSGKVVTYKQKLQLGEIRNPKARKKRYIASVHEAGHAIVYAYCTGNTPDSIVSVSTDKGGFCTTYDKESEGEIKSRIDVDNEVMVSLGGYLSEKLIFNQDLCLMGSSSDLESAWEELSENVYEVGYFNPRKYASREVESNSSIPGGFSDIEIREHISEVYENLKQRTEDILKEETKLLIEMAKYLGKTGSMNSQTFLCMVKDFGNSLTIEHMEEMKNKLNPEYYFNTLINGNSK